MDVSSNVAVAALLRPRATRTCDMLQTSVWGVQDRTGLGLALVLVMRCETQQSVKTHSRRLSGDVQSLVDARRDAPKLAQAKALHPGELKV